MADEKSLNNNSIRIGNSSSWQNVEIGGIAAGDINQNQSYQEVTIGSIPDTAEVVNLIGQLEALLQQSNLSTADQEKALKHLDTAKEEAQAEEPDKDYALKSFQRATKVLKDAGETVAASQGLWEQMEGIAQKLAPWFGVAAKALLFL
ncbi:MAG: hypothetical protein WBA57_23290 [Elainellaceae cyanobacterium]